MSLAIQCGTTGSVVVFVADDQPVIEPGKVNRYHFGPANYKLLKPFELSKFFQHIANSIEDQHINGLAVSIPGLLTEGDRKTLKNILNNVWRDLTRLWVGNDLEISLGMIPNEDYLIKSIVISGTGSCCYGTDGKIYSKIGGYGHLLGDRGSAYAIAHQALRLSLREYEYTHDDQADALNGESNPVKHYDLEESSSSIPLLTLLQSHLNLVSIVELINWSLVASKAEIAELTKVVLKAAECGNVVAKKVIDEATTDLVNDILCLIRKLKNGKPIEDNKICVGFTGSVFTCNPASFTEIVLKKLKENKCDAHFMMLTDTVFGALKMIIDSNKRKIAGFNLINDLPDSRSENGTDTSTPFHYSQTSDAHTRQKLRDTVLPLSTGLADTEQRNERSFRLCSMTLPEAVELMIDEEARANQSLKNHVSDIVTLVEKITEAFRCGGRLIYVGAGTSGRLGILDASECPPTFKTPPHWVQGIIAGGTKAVQSAIEGAEDSIEEGMSSIVEKDVCDRDIVIGIAACGKTPFVWGALHEATQRRAYTCLLTFNQNIQAKIRLDQVITVKTGPEVLTGSTRLKAGTATKCILNMLTTLSMVQYGKCLENLMVDLMPNSEKLRDRALRITMQIINDSKLSKDIVEAALIKNNYDIKTSVAELRDMK